MTRHKLVTKCLDSDLRVFGGLSGAGGHCEVRDGGGKNERVLCWCVFGRPVPAVDSPTIILEARLPLTLLGRRYEDWQESSLGGSAQRTRRLSQCTPRRGKAKTPAEDRFVTI